MGLSFSIDTYYNNNNIAIFGIMLVLIFEWVKG